MSSLVISAAFQVFEGHVCPALTVLDSTGLGDLHKYTSM